MRWCEADVHADFSAPLLSSDLWEYVYLYSELMPTLTKHTAHVPGAAWLRDRVPCGNSFLLMRFILRVLYTPLYHHQCNVNESLMSPV